MNPNKQSACHVMSKYAITRAGRDQRVQHACGAREDGASPLHIGPRLRRAFTKRRQPVRFVRTACRRADGACVRVPALRPSPERAGIKKSWVGFPGFGSVAGKIRIGRDGNYFPDF
jgi:hypothetical protein